MDERGDGQVTAGEAVALADRFVQGGRGGFWSASIERTRRLLAKAETVYETLLGFVDSGCSPFTVDELNGIIREIDTDLAALLASPPPVADDDDGDHASVPQSQLMIIIVAAATATGCGGERQLQMRKS
uniref:Uncharacterized protein n=1 Tax=Oryza glumipatula TaxID=40148 RepID=A0A0E0A5F5_9ORYZ